MRNLIKFIFKNAQYIKGGVYGPHSQEEEFDIWVRGLSDIQIKEIYTMYNHSSDALWLYFKANIYK